MNERMIDSFDWFENDMKNISYADLSDVLAIVHQFLKIIDD